MRGLQAHMHESLQSPSRTFKLSLPSAPNTIHRYKLSLPSAPNTPLQTKQDIIQLNLLLYLSCCLDTTLLTNVNLFRYDASHECQSSPFYATVHKFRGHYVLSSARFPNQLLFGKSGHKSTSQRISFSPIPFFFFLPWPTIFFSQTVM
jgi:hypothetical protein